jgi:hypothetical protein
VNGLDAGYVQGEVKILGGGGNGFLARFEVDGQGGITKIIHVNLGSGYTTLGTAVVQAQYAGTNSPMDQSLSNLVVVNGGRNYVDGDVIINPSTGTPFNARVFVNGSGSIISAAISSYGTGFDRDISVSEIQIFYRGSSSLQTNSITGVAIVSSGTMTQCTVGMTITALPAGSALFQAVVANVSVSGAITVVRVVSNGAGYMTDPSLVISSAACSCNGLAGNVAGNFDGCLRALVARGGLLSATRAYGATLMAIIPQLTISNLKETRTADSSSVAIRTSSIQGLENVFGSLATWLKTPGNITFSVQSNATLFPGRMYTVEFNLTNPIPSQYSPSVSIGWRGMVVSTIAMNKGRLNLAPLVIAGFQSISSIVYGSNTGQGETTTITFQLLPVATLFLGQILTFTGSESPFKTSSSQKIVTCIPWDRQIRT